MIKALLSVWVFLVFLFTAAAQEIGNTVPLNLQFRNLQNGQVVNIASLKGKVIIVECWATWCTPCVEALKDLDNWQQQFGNKLAVLAISEEKPERLQQFLQNRPNRLAMISDTAGLFRQYFPYRSIPHTIIIGNDGKVKAITSAGNLTAALIKKLLNNEAISLPVKKDNMNFDLETYVRTAFKADSTQAQHFAIQPPVEGAGTMSKMYPNSSFEDRRITVINGTIQLLVQLAYETNYYRVVNEYDGQLSYKQQEKFCIDAWVKEKSRAKLFEYFQQELGKQFIDMEIIKEKRKVKTTVLYADSTAGSKLQTCTEPLQNPGFINSLSYSVNCSGISDLVNYLESYGICGTAIIDETGLTGRYKLAFNLEPGKATALQDALQKMGLYMKREVREIEVIMIKKKR